jgi:hypothetical protein
MRIAALGLVLFVLSPEVAAAAPPPDLAEAYDLIGRWVDAQNQHHFDEYAALYADHFEGIKRTLSGKETAYKLPEWKVDRKKGFDKIAVEIFNEEYARLDEKQIGVMFRQAFLSGAYADRGLKKLKLEKGPNGLKIVHEEIKAVGKLDPNEDETNLPQGFAEDVRALRGRCTKLHQCPVYAVFGSTMIDPKEESDPRRVSLGVFRNDAEGEEGGVYHETLVVTPLYMGALKGSAFVIVESFWGDAMHGNLWNNSTVARRATLVGKGPEYPVLWTGDLLTWPKSELVKYKAKELGMVSQQLLPEARERSPKPIWCRFASFSDEAEKNLGAIYSCGKSRTLLEWKDGHLR